MTEDEMKKLMKDLDNAEPLPKDVKWVMRMADVNRDGAIQAGTMKKMTN